MARKNLIPSYKMIDAVGMDGNITSSTVNVQNMDLASIFVEWANGSTPVGTITVEARNGATGTWYTLDFGSAISVSGNSGSHQIRLDEMPFTDIRVIYTRSSGDGDLTATISAKQVGG